LLTEELEGLVAEELAVAAAVAELILFFMAAPAEAALLFSCKR